MKLQFMNLTYIKVFVYICADIKGMKIILEAGPVIYLQLLG